MKRVPKKPETQKVTVMLPRDLVEKAKTATGLGLTPTIRQGLETVVRNKAYDALRRLRGTEPFSMTWEELRGE
jgi:hypothetical protein